jgi:hypothetical protein
LRVSPFRRRAGPSRPARAGTLWVHRALILGGQDCRRTPPRQDKVLDHTRSRHRVQRPRRARRLPMRRTRVLQRRHRATPADVTRALITGGRDLTPAADTRQLTIAPISSISRNLASFRRREITRTLRPRAIDRRRSPAIHHRLVIRRRPSLVIRWALPAAAPLTGHKRTVQPAIDLS